MLFGSLLPLGLAAALVLLDQWSKAWVAATIPLGARDPSLGLGFYLTHTRNTGAAFGFLREFQLILGPVLVDGTLLLGLLSLVVAIGLTVYLFGRGRLSPLHTRVALALVLAGATGNMLDRLQRGYVVDFVHFQVGAFDFPVFNVADACVVAGAGMLILSALKGGSKARAREAEAAESAGDR